MKTQSGDTSHLVARLLNRGLLSKKAADKRPSKKSFPSKISKSSSSSPSESSASSFPNPGTIALPGLFIDNPTDSAGSSSLNVSQRTTVRDGPEDSIRLAARANDIDEVEIAQVDSWTAADCSQEDIEERLWVPEEEGSHGLSRYRGECGRERLERWIRWRQEQEEKKQREREQYEQHGSSGSSYYGNVLEPSELRKRNCLQSWRSIVGFVVRRDKQEADRSAVEPQIRSSCASDETIAKKGNKLFRAKRRIANLFRSVERPVESVIANERFLLE